MRCIKTISRPMAWAVVLAAALAGAIRAEEGPKLSGFVDFGYNYNFNKSTTNLNTLRTFDQNANSLTLQNAEIVAEGKHGDVVYRVDLDYGFDASQIHSGGFLTPGTPGNNIQTDVQQAYLTFVCPWSGALITAGKFVTPFGAEVIEAKDDYNISRGFLFNYAI